MKDQSLLLVAQRAYQWAQRAMPAFGSKFSQKSFTQPQLLAALLLKVYLRQTYREAEAWWVATDCVRGLLGLRQAPDHSTLCWLFHHKVNERLLARLLALRLPPYDPARIAVGRSRSTAPASRPDTARATTVGVVAGAASAAGPNGSLPCGCPRS